MLFVVEFVEEERDSVCACARLEEMKIGRQILSETMEQ